MKLALVTCALAIATISLVACDGHDDISHDPGAAGHESEYAGQEDRRIKSLSAEDIAELETGGGWGLAKAGELNGVPGPAHLLEMKTEIGLSEEQVASIETLYAEMKVEAIALGKEIIALETELNDAFADGSIDQASLESWVNDISDRLARLRIVHLSTHLKTPAILSAAQIAKYNELRGYATDPCDSVPEGHDPEQWRSHNGCE